VCLLGFLKFLKRDKKKDIGLDSFDVPPLPPDMKGKEFDKLPELPEIPDIDHMPSGGKHIPDMKKFEPKIPVPEIEIPEMDKIPELEELPELPDLEEPPELPKQPARPLFKPKFIRPNVIKKEMPKAHPDEIFRTDDGFYEKHERAAVQEEKRILQHKDVGKGPVYIRIDKFRIILSSVNTIKREYKKCSRIN